MPKSHQQNLRAHRVVQLAQLVDLFGGQPERKAPKEFRLLAAGIIGTEKGEFLFDDQAAASVMENYLARAVDLSIDYDHQSLAWPPVESPAAGWFNLELRGGELWATNVRWSDRARERIEAGEYRYFSPALGFDEKSLRVNKVINCAITNNPAMHDIPALVAASATLQEEDIMTLEEQLKKANERIAELEGQVKARDAEVAPLRTSVHAMLSLSAMIGLTASASADDVKTQVGGLVTLRTKLREVTGKDQDAAALGVVEGWKAEAADAARLKTEMAAKEAAALNTEFDAVMGEACKAGKIPPATEHPRHALALTISGKAGGKVTKEGIAGLRAYVETLNVLNGDTPTNAPQPALGQSTEGTQVAKLLGHDPVEVNKWAAEQRAKGIQI